MNITCSYCNENIDGITTKYYIVNQRTACSKCFNNIISNINGNFQPNMQPNMQPNIQPNMHNLGNLNNNNLNIPTNMQTNMPTNMPNLGNMPNLLNGLNMNNNSNNNLNNNSKPAFTRIILLNSNKKSNNNDDNDDDDDKNDNNEDDDDKNDDNDMFNPGMMFINSIINSIKNLDKPNDEDDSNDDSNNDSNNNSNMCCGSHSFASGNSKNIFDPSLNINDIKSILEERRTDKKISKQQKTSQNSKKKMDIDNEEEEDTSNYEFEWIGPNIKTISDLIEIGKNYNPKKRKRYNLDLKRLNALVEPLTELNNMIGMDNIKKIIFDQIIYYLQSLDTKNVDMLHTVIVGPPGVGKTQLTHIIAKIYNRLGFLKTDKVVSVKRCDLVAEYVGQTAIKTKKILDKALGGVLLIDEAYSLSSTSDKDFAKESVDLINMYLSEHAHEMACIIAGYKKPIYEKFMGMNEGLSRRFTHHYEIKGYNANELALIFKKYVEEQKWTISASIEEVSTIIGKNMDVFPYFGGDMTTLFACSKKTHSRRLMLISTENELNATRKKLNLKDIEDAITMFKEIKEKNSDDEDIDRAKYSSIYM